MSTLAPAGPNVGPRRAFFNRELVMNAVAPRKYPIFHRLATSQVVHRGTGGLNLDTLFLTLCINCPKTIALYSCKDGLQSVPRGGRHAGLVFIPPSCIRFATSCLRRVRV